MDHVFELGTSRIQNSFKYHLKAIPFLNIARSKKVFFIHQHGSGPSFGMKLFIYQQTHSESAAMVKHFNIIFFILV